jgi:hypothetical protein
MKTYNKNPEAVSLLTPEQYRVTQQDGTERPFGNEYWDNKWTPAFASSVRTRGLPNTDKGAIHAPKENVDVEHDHANRFLSHA